MQSLAKAEMGVMNLLWRSPERLTARTIREQLYPDASKAQHGTVQKLLQRLEDKGLVHRVKLLSVHVFYAALTRQDYAGRCLESLAEELTDGSFAPLVTHLVERQKVSRNDLDNIRAILDAYQSREPARSEVGTS